MRVSMARAAAFAAAGISADCAATSLSMTPSEADVVLAWNGRQGAAYVVERVAETMVSPAVHVDFAGRSYALHSGPAWRILAILAGAEGAMTFRDASVAGAGGPRLAGYRVSVSHPAPPDGMVPIPGGRFIMGDVRGILPANDEPAHDVFVDPFWIDAAEVTNARYTAWLNEAHVRGDLVVVDNGEVRNSFGLVLCRVQPRESRSRIVYDADGAPPFSVETGGSAEGGYGTHPVVFVTPRGAAAFAASCGMRLPTEAEWEKAARGGLTGHHYPWPSDEADYNACISPADANYYVLGMPHGTVRVMSYAANAYGVYDVAGNVNEWCCDWYSTSANYYTTYAPDRWPPNPRGPSYTGRFSVRGGDFNQFPSQLRCCSRQSAGEFDLGPSIGFRCVISSAW